jgi:hypothetical protein
MALLALVVTAAPANAGEGQASAATLKVCPSGCSYGTIQAAIDAASDGDTIEVAAGSYAGFAVPHTNASLTNVSVTGAGAGKTTISGGGPVVEIDSGAVTIGGVTITGGFNDGTGGTTAPGCGGGVFNAGTLTLNNSTVTNNTSVSGGGICNVGMDSVVATLTLNNTRVSNNTALGSCQGGGSGGGIATFGRSSATLKNSIVIDNASGCGGGGIALAAPFEEPEAASLTLQNSKVTGNTALSAGGIVAFSGVVTLFNSNITGNTATGGSGTVNGIDILDDATLTLTNSKVQPD